MEWRKTGSDHQVSQETEDFDFLTVELRLEGARITGAITSLKMPTIIV
jgi:hypothetical protein